MPEPAPLPDQNGRAFSRDELAIVRRAYARQMLAILGVDNPPIEAAYAAVPREAFLGPAPWTASSPFTGYRPLSGRDPVVLYQNLLIALDPARGVNNGSPSLHAKLLEALGPKPGEHIVHVGAGAGYYSAILAELVGPAGQVTAVEFDTALAARAESFLFGRGNVRVVHGDGARWPETATDGVYVNFAVSRPADRWIEGLSPGGRLVFPLGVPGPSGRIPPAGTATAARRSGSNGAATPMRRGRSARPILFAARENSRRIAKSRSACAPPSRRTASTRSAA
jgi:protein-L-isoaspartate(D-aspartate) O-methyltransferase